MSRPIVRTLALGSLAPAAAAQACMGEDPILTADAGSSQPQNDASASAVDGSEANDGGVRDFGIFLTSESFPTDFAKGVDAGSLDVFVDGLCKDAASRAGLPNAQSYAALIALSSTLDGTADLARISVVRDRNRPSDRWCAIRENDGVRRPDCAMLLGVIFANTDEFLTGPSNTLAFNEYGKPKGDRAFQFFSGVYYAEGEIDPIRIRTCQGWQNRSDGDASGSGFEFEVGIGIAAPPPPGTAAFQWAGRVGQQCVDGVSLPLFCLELPSE